MQFRKLALSVAAVTALGAFSSANAYTTHEEQIIVHPFQWTYDMIADECEEVLGPKGFDGVQISQPAEHIDRRDVWWAVYQPVNFNNFTTMTGNEQQLRNMIKRCNAAGVRVYADAVFNQRGNAGNRGLGGSYYDARSFNYPDLDPSDFNNYNCSPNYGDQWSIWHCALSGMPDLNVENEATQQKIANYLKNLMSMGVYGFRIDAAKHMQPWGISGVLAKAGNPLAYMEVIGAHGEAVQPGDYTNIPNSVVTEFRYCPTMQNNINNPKVLLNMNDSWFDVPSDGAETFIVNHDNERGSAGTSYLNYKNSPRYSIAQSFLVAWPYGKIRQVYTGYKFDQHDPAGPFGDARCTGGWNCEHRVSVVMNAVGFARATRGYGVSYKGASDDGKVIWFTRGDKGFYVMNSSDQPIKWTFDTHMPDGVYSEILQQPDPSKGQKITVKNGKAEIMVYDKSAAAICIDDSGRGFCGNGPVPPVTKDLYFAGTTNNWKFDKFDYDAEKREYTLNLQLTGAGDANGPQRFKLTTAADWKHTIYGDATDNKICSDEVKCPDIVIPEQGSYVLTVSLDDKSWKLVGDVPGCNPSVDALYFAGTTNSWTHEPMNFDYESCKWTVDLNLTGDGDNNGSQRFKVTTAPNWNDKVYGTAGGNKLCSNQAKCGDVYITEKGQYTLSVNDKEFTWELTKNGGDTYIPATRDAMYFAGTTNKWKHTAMKYNSSTGDWEIALNLTGAGDNGGAQRFKVTSAANWKGTVWGDAGGNSLCSNQSSCGDVYISETGNYVLKVNDKNLTWVLDAQ